MVLIVLPSALMSILLITLSTLSGSDCYDPLDPNGNISITFDIYQRTENGYLVSFINYVMKHSTQQHS